jgi:hypothetical protein
MVIEYTTCTHGAPANSGQLNSERLAVALVTLYLSELKKSRLKPISLMARSSWLLSCTHDTKAKSACQSPDVVFLHWTASLARGHHNTSPVYLTTARASLSKASGISTLHTIPMFTLHYVQQYKTQLEKVDKSMESQRKLVK